MSVSAEDREKAIELMVMAELDTHSNLPDPDRALNALIAAGWGPAGVPVRMDFKRDDALEEALRAVMCGCTWDEGRLNDQVLAVVEALAARGFSIVRAGVPVVDRETLAKALRDADAAWVPGGQNADDPKRWAFYLDRAEKVLASGVLLDAADIWDECLAAIEANELNTKQAREGNPYRSTEGGGR